MVIVLLCSFRCEGGPYHPPAGLLQAAGKQTVLFKRKVAEGHYLEYMYVFPQPVRFPDPVLEISYTCTTLKIVQNTLLFHPALWAFMLACVDRVVLHCITFSSVQ